MNKRLRFLYRYITTPYRWRRWINRQTAMVLVVSSVFFFTLAWTGPMAKFDSATIAQTLTPAKTLTLNPANALTPTPFPAEFYTNGDQTIGITLAGAVLVLIVVVGVISFLPKKEEE